MTKARSQGPAQGGRPPSAGPRQLVYDSCCTRGKSEVDLSPQVPSRTAESGHRQAARRRKNRFSRQRSRRVAAMVDTDHRAGLQASECITLGDGKVCARGEGGDAIVRRARPGRGRRSQRTDRSRMSPSCRGSVDAQAAGGGETDSALAGNGRKLLSHINTRAAVEAKATGGARCQSTRGSPLARQAWFAMEGARPCSPMDDRSGHQMSVHASTQVSRYNPCRLAAVSDRQGQVRVISPEWGGGFGSKVSSSGRAVRAWLALKFRRRFRYVEDRREPWW